MIEIDDTLVSSDIVDNFFFCDTSSCHGACCIEGDSGAPLTEEETEILEKILPMLWDNLSTQSQQIIREQGAWVVDSDGDFVTPIVGKRECVYSYFESDGTCKCTIERAYSLGLIKFYKPISCHLYPIRLTETSNHTLLNYNRWDVCATARTLGKSKGIRVFQFLKDPLIRRFGYDWYEALSIAAKRWIQELSHQL